MAVEITTKQGNIIVDCDDDVIIINGIEGIEELYHLWKKARTHKDPIKNFLSEIAEIVGEYICPICGKITQFEAGCESCELGDLAEHFRGKEDE